MISITKYANRKYYAKHLSRHVTLQDLDNMVMAGNEIRVIDKVTKNDITGQVIIQLISIRSREINPLRPVSELVDLMKKSA